MKGLYPSLMSADPLNLGSVIDSLEPVVAGFHIDCMDFSFAPNATWGPWIANAVRGRTKKRVWVDLLVDDPERYITELSLFPGDLVTIHYESRYSAGCLDMIRELGLNPGVAINPETSYEVLKPLIPKLGHVVVMGVKPGFSGQKFEAHALKKLEALSNFITYQGLTCELGIDGGMDQRTIPLAQSAGATLFVAGSAIFSAKQSIQEAQNLAKLID